MTLLWHQGRARLREKQQARAGDLLEAVGMGHGASHRAGRLSNGKQQRVGIAGARSTIPRSSPADEPTGNPATRTGRIVKLFATFTREWQKIAMLVTHDDRLADVADVRMELLEGRLRTG